MTPPLSIRHRMAAARVDLVWIQIFAPRLHFPVRLDINILFRVWRSRHSRQSLALQRLRSFERAHSKRADLAEKFVQRDSHNNRRFLFLSLSLSLSLPQLSASVVEGVNICEATQPSPLFSRICENVAKVCTCACGGKSAEIRTSSSPLFCLSYFS